ncbi:SWIM zinc finger family protein [Actinomadura decatromicini]|uniref:SWIM-type domain-containing protein n=1 Tax=Actinomadura decatromicini TaxID=2604572 RepID=A0A5D3F909_9ACTN|nr:SWIM zinc finger family protein [Actinomadura decatromicini]TYK44589.1 hypothetical protein FXF68_34645 [Actinomadura decatromicini]
MNVEEDSAIVAKRKKAHRYTKEPGRVTLREFRVTMQSEHAQREVSFSNEIWSCTCDFYAMRKTCSHVMAVQEMLFDNLGIRRP